MIKQLFRIGTILLFITCLFGVVKGSSVAFADEVPTSFDIRTTTPTIKEKNTFAITVVGSNLNKLYAYDLTIDIPTGVTLLSVEDNLSGGTPVFVQNGNTLRYGSTKSGQAAGESGTKTLTTLTFQAGAPGIVDFKLVKVKNLINLETGLHATVHDVPKKLTIQITSDNRENNGNENGNGNANGNSSGNGNTKAFRDITEEDGNGQVASGQVIVSAEGPVRVSIGLLQKWTVQNSSAVIVLKVGNITYSIPLSEMTSGAWRDELGDQADKAVITINVTEASKEQGDKFERAATKIGTNLLIKPIDFEMIAETPSGEKVTITKFTRYVPRSFQLDVEVESSHTIGVYMDEATGELLPVPTVFRSINGKTVAELFRKGNSVYSLIRLEKHFADLEGHWSESLVESMANKLIVNGLSDQIFGPDKPVTRAEFASMLVRALSLDRNAGNTSFADINGQWYDALVQSAADAGLVSGYPDKTFRPEATLNRQELAVILQRAVQFTGQPWATSEVSGSVRPFVDFNEAAPWSQQAIAQAAAAGLIEGDEQNTFRPEAQTTRGEAAAVLNRLLTFAGMYSG
ncbi:S-layer homology domain-containing protein [Paenibacillus sp. LjRoot153]|uniref:S-layer homology domain-containing protein n=1 Tax=Paenibacillus sp. LjRoot153 TaxID=3342270 RepID=UPI003ECEF855